MDSATVVIIVAAAIYAVAWQLFSLSNDPGRAGCGGNSRGQFQGQSQAQVT